MKTRHTEGPWNVFIADDGGQWTGWTAARCCRNPAVFTQAPRACRGFFTSGAYTPVGHTS
jgi:hypothetical protein